MFRAFAGGIRARRVSGFEHRRLQPDTGGHGWTMGEREHGKLNIDGRLSCKTHNLFDNNIAGHVTLTLFSGWAGKRTP